MTNKSLPQKAVACCFLLGLCVVGGFSSCTYDKELVETPGPGGPDACNSIPAAFNAQVLPLLSTKCAIAGCHDASAAGGLVFQNYAQISAAKDRINTQAVVQQSMPPSGPLPVADMDVIRCWIAAGAPNN